MNIRIRTGGTRPGPGAPHGRGAPPHAPPGAVAPAGHTSRRTVPAPDAPVPTRDADAEADQLVSLHQWLQDDYGLPRDTAVALRTAPGPEAMGGAWEAIDVVLTHATALAGLALAVATWRRTRAEPPTVRIEANGVTVTLTAGQDHDAESVRRLLGALAPPQE